MVIPSQKLDEVIEILRSVAQRTRFEPGCISCNVYLSTDPQNEIMIEDIWKNKENLACHLRSEEYQKILLIAEMAEAPPEIKFYRIQSTSGVETIEKARRAGGGSTRMRPHSSAAI